MPKTITIYVDGYGNFKYENAVQHLAPKETVQWVSKTYPTNPAAVAAASVYVLKLMGITIGGWMLARSAEVASRMLAQGEGDAEFLKGKILTARFFAEHILAEAPALAAAATRGADSVLAVEEAML